MADQIVSFDVALEACRRAPFSIADVARRAQGHAFEALGLGPDECAYKIADAGQFWRLRDYGGNTTGRPLLIVAAPIKRPYIWDLAPSASAIRHCLDRSLRVHVLEWLPASQTSGNNGLAEYVAAIASGVGTISSSGTGTKPFLIGHSLGGTLAAIFAAHASESIQGIVLLSAPLCFRPATCRFRDALVSLLPPSLSEAEHWPGSLLSYMSALASPETFVWARLMDAAATVTDHHAQKVRALVERWALDEVSLPGKLMQQMVEWLYREDRFCRGKLKIGDRFIGPHTLTAPTLLVVNTADEIAPMASLKPFLDAMPKKDARILEYRGELGTCLQHLGVLIGRKALTQLWPEIVSWIELRK